MDREGSDQTMWMRRLIQVSTVHICPKTFYQVKGHVCMWPLFFPEEELQNSKDLDFYLSRKCLCGQEINTPVSDHKYQGSNTASDCYAQNLLL